MTYLVMSLASCLFFAQLLGLLLGWLIWGYAAMQRKKEIAMLRKRLGEMSLQTMRPMEDALPRSAIRSSPASSFGSRKPEWLPPDAEAVFADLPPLPALPDPQEEEAAAEALKLKDAVAVELRRQVDSLKAQLSTLASQKEAQAVSFKDQLETLTAQASTTSLQSEPSQAGLPEEIEKLKKQLVSAGEERAVRAAESQRQANALLELSKELNSVTSERDQVAGEVKTLRAELAKRAEKTGELERKVAAFTSEISFAVAEKEKTAAELRTARSDFEKRSAWLTKRIHELERSAEEWERTKQDFALTMKAETSKARDAGHDGHLLALQGAELAELRQRLSSTLQERDTMAAEIAGHKNGAGQAPARIAELEDSLRAKDSQLADVGTRGERLMARVSELESLVRISPQLEEALKQKDSHIAELTADAAERDSHVRTLLRRMTELEPFNEKIVELRAQLKDKELELSQRAEAYSELEKVAARIPGLETSIKDKESTIASQLAAHAESQRKAAETLSQRTDELQRSTENASSLDSELKRKQAALAALETAHSEKIASIQTLNSQVEELSPFPGKLQDLAEKHQADLTRLKVSSAQRLRRLRQGITTFKS